jgi:hypothetical protein
MLSTHIKICTPNLPNIQFWGCMFRKIEMAQWIKWSVCISNSQQCPARPETWSNGTERPCHRTESRIWCELQDQWCSAYSDMNALRWRAGIAQIGCGAHSASYRTGIGGSFSSSSYGFRKTLLYIFPICIWLVLSYAMTHHVKIDFWCHQINKGDFLFDVFHWKNWARFNSSSLCTRK